MKAQLGHGRPNAPAASLFHNLHGRCLVLLIAVHRHRKPFDGRTGVLPIRPAFQKLIPHLKQRGEQPADLLLKTHQQVPPQIHIPCNLLCIFQILKKIRRHLPCLPLVIQNGVHLKV